MSGRQSEPARWRGERRGAAEPRGVPRGHRGCHGDIARSGRCGRELFLPSADILMRKSGEYGRRSRIRGNRATRRWPPTSTNVGTPPSTAGARPVGLSYFAYFAPRQCGKVSAQAAGSGRALRWRPSASIDGSMRSCRSSAQALDCHGEASPLAPIVGVAPVRRVRPAGIDLRDRAEYTTFAEGAGCTALTWGWQRVERM